MIRVEIEGKGKVAEFPDGTDPSVIDQTIKKDFFNQEAAALPTVRQPGEHPIIPEEEARLSWAGKEDQGAAYPLGEDPRQGFFTRMGESFLDPTQLIANLAGGYSQSGVRGAVDWALGGMPSLAKGSVRGIQALSRALSRETKAAPVEAPVKAVVEIVRPPETVPEIPGRVMPWEEPSRYPTPELPQVRRAPGYGKGPLGEVGVPPSAAITRKFPAMREGLSTPPPVREMVAPPGGAPPVKPPSLPSPPPSPPPTGGPPTAASRQSALTDGEWKFLKEDTSTSGAHRGLFTRVKEVARGGLMEVQSPYEVFRKEPSGMGWDLWQVSEKFERFKNVFLQKQYTDFRKAVQFGPGSSQSNLVGELLDRYQDWKEVLAGVPPEIRQHLTPEIKKAFNYIRESWSKLGDDLIQRGLMSPTRKVGAYLFHMFDKDTIVQAWKDELTILRTTGGDPQRIQKLQHSVDTFQKTGALLYDVLPKSLNVPFLNPRKGAPGYSLDAVRAYNAWLKYYAKKTYTEPVLKVGVESMKVMNPEFRQYTKEYLKRYADLDKDWRLAPLERALTSLTYLDALGWNVRSALTNATQHLNTVVELGPSGPLYLGKAIAFARSPQGRSLWEASGHAAEVPELRWGLMEQHVEKALGWSFKLFDKVELGNRKIAFFGGYLKALSEGAIPEAAIKAGDTTLRKTQFLYGKVGAPMLMTRPGGRTVMQFTTFSIKQLELFNNWARQNPGKLAAYIITASAAQEGLQEIGVDMSNALGVGVDIGELTHAIGHLGRWEGKAAWAHAKVGLPRTPLLPFQGAGSGIFPSGLAPSISMVSNLIQGQWQRTIPPQMERLYTGGRALLEGQLPEGGYPVRVPGEPTLRHRENLPQLLLRTFITKPAVEGEATRVMTRERMFEESRRANQNKVASLIVEGRREEARELAKTVGWPTQQMIEGERERRGKTTLERRIQPPSGTLRRYERKIGEEPEELRMGVPRVREPDELRVRR